MNLLLNIKKENDDLGKQVNNLTEKRQLKIQLIARITILLIIFSQNLQAQEITYDNSKKYTLAGVSVAGNTSFDDTVIISYSRLRKGKLIDVPGEDIANAIKKLWKTKLFSNVEIYIDRIEGDAVYLQIKLIDLPQLNNVKINGIKKHKKDDFIKENKLQKGVKVTENLIATTKNFIETKYQKKGFLNTKVFINTIPVQDSSKAARVNMVVNIDKGEKVKIQNIIFEGNHVLKSKKLRKAMKNTKRIRPFAILKRSKFIDSTYRADLQNVISTYKENGYRDARIVSDSVMVNSNDRIALKVKVHEGDLYKFGDIEFIGNATYSDQALNRILRIRKGDIYNGVLLKKRISDTKPDAFDIANHYQNNGYLFSQINAVEVSAENNIIDLQIRITEGKPAYFKNVTVSGNKITNDHVIYRELRTRPGQLYSKANVIRTVRQLGQLNFFDAQKLNPDIKNPNPNDGTVDIDYVVEEAGSSQVELQGGYGGGGFIGTFGLSLNNFSIKNVGNIEAYTPVPRGDGQKLALRLQASRFYRTYSLSFSEPWLGGKRPVQFSTSLSHTKQFRYDRINRKANKDERFDITGITIGLGKRLRAPDDYFSLSQSIGFQYYSLKNYNTGLFTFGNGDSRNLFYSIGLSRDNTNIDPIYPTGGSSFSILAKLTFPYSLFSKVDYAALKAERDRNADLLQTPGLSTYERNEASRIVGEKDQERYRWLEFYKINFKGTWYTQLAKKLVLRPNVEFGFLGAYKNDRGIIPFERFFVGGDGLGTYSLDGRETVRLRGYPNQSLSEEDGGTVYNKFSLELRYPITLKSQAKIYVLSFLEGGASFDGFRDYDPFKIKRSGGVGLRLFMPAFGLLGIDFGYGFDAVPNSGEVGSHGWETHFIFGQRF